MTATMKLTKAQSGVLDAIRANGGTEEGLILHADGRTYKILARLERMGLVARDQFPPSEGRPYGSFGFYHLTDPALGFSAGS